MADRRPAGYYRLKVGTLDVMDQVARERAQRQTLEELAHVPTKPTETHSPAAVTEPTSVPSKEK